jgi:uncharacterized protein (DUF58 family)
MAYDTTLPARHRLAAIEQATALVGEVDDGPITFAIDQADEVDETYWNIVLACVNAAAGLVTSARHAHDVVTIAADGYRVIVETRLATQRAEAELAVLARQSKAEEPERHGL